MGSPAMESSSKTQESRPKGPPNGDPRGDLGRGLAGSSPTTTPSPQALLAGGCQPAGCPVGPPRPLPANPTVTPTAPPAPPPPPHTQKKLDTF